MPILTRRTPLHDLAPPTRPATPARPAAPAPGEHASDEPSAGPNRSHTSRFRRRAFGAVSLALAALVFVGLVLRLTVRDGFAPLAPLFYALSVPMLVVVGLAAMLTGAMARGLRLTFKRCVAAATFGLLAAANAAIFLDLDPTFDDRPRVVLWNTARGAAGWEDVADALEAHRPTLAVLIESGEDAEAAAYWRERFGKEYFLAQPGAGITVLSRGPIDRVEPVTLANAGFAVRVNAEFDGQRIAVVAVDLSSDPMLDRGAPMREVMALATAAAGERPTLVAGDFNTPPESVHFDALRRAGFLHAFEQHGRGYAATWPVPAPVLHLDHIWMSSGFEMGEVSHGWSAQSDHRPVLAPTRVAAKRFAASQSVLPASQAHPPSE